MDVARETVTLSGCRLRENIWHLDHDADVAYVRTTDESFALSREAALAFLQMRPYCTGHHSPARIAELSGLPQTDVETVLHGLSASGILLAPGATETLLAEVPARLVGACRLWGEELNRTYIGNRLAEGGERTLLVGWLLEMQHYIKAFPAVIWHAAAGASGALKDVLERYAGQEEGHEEFVIRTLENLGLSRAEVIESAPLVSTRTIIGFMHELVDLEPAAMLLIAALVEAQEFDEVQVQRFTDALSQTYGIPGSAFTPYFEHQQIDVQLGHAQLLDEHLDLVSLSSIQQADLITDRLHDLKHAFDLQGLEIQSYYAALQGKYLPRQPMRVSSL